MNSLAGMAHAVLGGQPLLVLRPTGPITLIVTILSNVADCSTSTSSRCSRRRPSSRC